MSSPLFSWCEHRHAESGANPNPDCDAGGKLGLTNDELMGMIRHNKQVCVRHALTFSRHSHLFRALVNDGLPSYLCRAGMFVLRATSSVVHRVLHLLKSLLHLPMLHAIGRSWHLTLMALMPSCTHVQVV